MVNLNLTRDEANTIYKLVVDRIFSPELMNVFCSDALVSEAQDLRNIKRILEEQMLPSKTKRI